MEQELQKIYDSEINVQITSLWDAEWRVAVMVGNEWKSPSKYDICSLSEVITCLQDAIKEYLPESEYAKSLTT